MDRIREAVQRARDAQPKAPDPSVSAGVTSGASVGAKRPGRRQKPFHQRADDDDAAERFVAVKCNFDNFAANRIISNEQDPVLNAYRVLRTRVLQRMEENGWRSLAIVSPGAGAGKTVTAINLSIAIGSKEGSRSTLVDLDFYRPRVAHYLGLSEPPSILDFFEGKKNLEDVTLRPDLMNTLVIANERVTRRGAEHLTSARTDELINRSIHEFGSRVVIFDMSPLLGCDDTIAFLPKVDCVLLVAASGQTRVSEFNEAKRLLSNMNTVGAILNKAPTAFMPNPYY